MIALVQDTGTEGPPKWGGHVGDLLCRYTERRAPRAIGHLPPQRRSFLPCLLRPGTKATDSHWNKRTPSSESCQKSVARQLRPGHAHVHRELTDTSKPLLCLRDVLCRLGRKTVRRIIHGLRGPCNGGVLGLRSLAVDCQTRCSARAAKVSSCFRIDAVMGVPSSNVPRSNISR